MVASDGLYYSLHIYMFYNDNQPHHIHTHISYISSLHLSLWAAALVTFNEAMKGFNWSCFLLHILGMLLLRASNGRSVHIHILRIDSFSFTLKSLRSSPFCALAGLLRRQWLFVCSFAGALVFVSISFVSFLRVKVVHYTQKKELAAGLDPSDFRENVHKSYILPQNHCVLAFDLKIDQLKNNKHF